MKPTKRKQPTFKLESFRGKSGRLILRPRMLTQVPTRQTLQTGMTTPPTQGVLAIPEPTISDGCPLARQSKRSG